MHTMASQTEAKAMGTGLGAMPCSWHSYLAIGRHCSHWLHMPPAGLLHDTVEDTQDHSTPASFEQIELTFGKAVRRIVEGETRFSKISKVGCCHDAPGELWGRDAAAVLRKDVPKSRIQHGLSYNLACCVGGRAFSHCTSEL